MRQVPCGRVRVRVPGPTPSGPNSGSRMFMLRVKPCQREFATDEIRERKYTSTERSNGSIPFADSESATQPVA